MQDGRLGGRLEVSRSFGDSVFKQMGACSVPHVLSFQMGDCDKFVLVACDGFWNLWSPEDAVNTASALLDEGRDEKAVTNRLLNITVRERRCKDNCTVMIISLVPRVIE